jgi:hypothetical protein
MEAAITSALGQAGLGFTTGVMILLFFKERAEKNKVTEYAKEQNQLRYDDFKANSELLQELSVRTTETLRNLTDAIYGQNRSK